MQPTNVTPTLLLGEGAPALPAALCADADEAVRVIRAGDRALVATEEVAIATLLALGATGAEARSAVEHAVSGWS